MLLQVPKIDVSLNSMNFLISSLAIVIYGSISIVSSSLLWIHALLLFGIFIYSFWKHQQLLRQLSLTTFCIILLSIFSSFQYWPLPSFVTTATMAVWMVKTNPSFLNFKSHIISKEELGISFLFAVVASVAVYLWWLWVDLPTDQIPFKIPKINTVLLIPTLILFCALNAFAEEFVFRGLAINAISECFQTPWIAVFIQALAFGFIHYQGFPSGISGTILGFIFALMMGFLRIRTRGLFSPWLAHFLTDVTIALIILNSGLSQPAIP